MNQMYYSYVPTPIGKLLIAGTASVLKVIGFPTEKQKRVLDPDWIDDNLPLAPVIEQLMSYFNGDRQTFDLQLSLNGTTFQKRVWQELREIPYGKTTSYGEIARKIGRPKAFRAVGVANGQNPIPIVIPCHRVIAKSGDLTGFGGGLELKEKLLSLERKLVSLQMNFSFAISKE